LIVEGANHQIAGSDSVGGINAALTVALAKASATSSSSSASSVTASVAQSYYTVQGTVARRFGVSSIAEADAASVTPSATPATSAPLQTTARLLLSVPMTNIAESATAHDQALLALSAIDDWAASVLDVEDELANAADSWIEQQANSGLLA
jgi:hypothetical protein